MHIVIVDIHVKPDVVDQFIEATIENAQNSRQEPGIARFDFIQHQEDPTHFVLYEVYRSADEVENHRATAHYNRWRERVADMMAQPRVGTKFRNLDPTDATWA